MNATEVSHVPPDFITVWECEPPPDGAPFRVLDEEWTDDYHERHIRSWSGA